jgi:hypothetical protein
MRHGHCDAHSVGGVQRSVVRYSQHQEIARDGESAGALNTPNLMFPASLRSLKERVDTVIRNCSGRLSWRHRARPSTTLHEIQARPKGANMNCLL